MSQTLILNIPFVVFYLYAYRACRQKRLFAAQPATAASYLFLALLVKMLLGMGLSLLFGNHVSTVMMQFMMILHIGLFAALVGIATAWRSEPMSRNLKYGIAGAVVVKVMTYFIPMVVRAMNRTETLAEMQNVFLITSLFTGLLNFAIYMILLRAIFDGRGYPIPTQESVQSSEGTVPGGMFREEDYLPYLTGVMVLGGMVVIPIAWGHFLNIPYGQSLFSSLVSCILFSVSHDKRGNFKWSQFLVLYLVAFASLMRSTLQHGSGKPVYLAGGFLGILVMLGCGWVGIVIARLLRERLRSS